MRSETEIRAMRDQLFRRWLASDETAVEEILTALGWVLDSRAPDRELLDRIELADDEHEGLHAEDVLLGLVDAAGPHNPQTRDHLNQIADAGLTELAAAARRIDRACKTELKKRTTT
jgi:hypothetical protein